MIQYFFFSIFAYNTLALYAENTTPTSVPYYKRNLDAHSCTDFPYLEYVKTSDTVPSLLITPKTTLPNGYGPQTWKEYAQDKQQRKTILIDAACTAAWTAGVFLVSLFCFTQMDRGIALDSYRDEKLLMIDMLAILTMFLGVPLTWQRYTYHNEKRLSTFVYRNT